MIRWASCRLLNVSSSDLWKIWSVIRSSRSLLHRSMLLFLASFSTSTLAFSLSSLMRPFLHHSPNTPTHPHTHTHAPPAPFLAVTPNLAALHLWLSHTVNLHPSPFFLRHVSCITELLIQPYDALQAKLIASWFLIVTKNMHCSLKMLNWLWYLDFVCPSNMEMQTVEDLFLFQKCSAVRGQKTFWLHILPTRPFNEGN